jgi:hypothetical protein
LPGASFFERIALSRSLGPTVRSSSIRTRSDSCGAAVSSFREFSPRPSLGRAGASLAVLAVYAATSIVVFGWALWPHPGRAVIGLTSSQDPEIFIWSFAWWSHAIGSLTNPFVTHAIYSPVGVNLTWTASGPGLGLVFVPLTSLVGPTVAYNVAMLALPALGAWTAFLLCRYLTGSVWASVVGGYLFGFSSYVVAHEWGGDPNLAVFLLPVVALCVLRHVRGELVARGLAWRLGLVLAFEFTVSTEVALTLTFALAVSLAIASAFFRSYRRRLASAVVPIAAGYGIAAVLAAPFIVYLLTGFESEKFVGSSGGDLLNIVLPTRFIAAGGSVFASIVSDFTSNDVDRDLYLGVPTLLIFALYVCKRRRDGSARFLLAGLAVAWILALGRSLEVDGRRVIALPWSVTDSLPIIGNATPNRFAAYMSLVASVGVALWIGSTRGRFLARPVVLPLLALASMVPAAWSAGFVRNPHRPEFFSHALYKLCIPRGETLAIFPYARFGDSMLYQAESGFWFKMAEGHLGRDTYPPKFVFADPTVVALQFYWYDRDGRPTMRQLKSFAKRRSVDRIVSVEPLDYPSGPQMHTFGRIQDFGGVLVAPACGYDSLAGDTRRIPGHS